MASRFNDNFGVDSSADGPACGSHLFFIIGRLFKMCYKLINNNTGLPLRPFLPDPVSAGGRGAEGKPGGGV